MHAHDIEVHGVDAQLHYVPVRVDEAWHDRLTTQIDSSGRSRERIACVQQPHYLAIAADQNSREMLYMPLCIDLDAIGMIDQRVGESRRSEQRCYERNREAAFHAQWLSIVRRAVKG
jgi:hypothetical protein